MATHAWTIRPATPDDDVTIANHFAAMWADNNVGAQQMRCDWMPRTLAFIAEARRGRGFGAVVAEADGKPVGSAAAQLFGGLYPDVLTTNYRHYGYIWGVHVDPGWRRRKIGEGLTRACVDHLRAQGCSRVILHATPFGRPVYERLGFAASNEMRLDLI
jgi:ribosomal protein S18 acetylase RimI-like enzyme